jgi:hypothetical protein
MVMAGASDNMNVTDGYRLRCLFNGSITAQEREKNIAFLIDELTARFESAYCRDVIPSVSGVRNFTTQEIRNLTLYDLIAFVPGPTPDKFKFITADMTAEQLGLSTAPQLGQRLDDIENRSVVLPKVVEALKKEYHRLVHYYGDDKSGSGSEKDAMWE